MKAKSNHFDVIIIGSGPGGLTAAIYTSRSNLKTLIIDKSVPGGKLIRTHRIENWPGEKIISGKDLAKKMFEHALSFGAIHKFGQVNEIINYQENQKQIILNDGTTFFSKSLIIATGMNERVPKDIKNIDKFNNKGVSYCAVCDGPLFKNTDTIIIGGGNSAFEESLFLANFAKSVEILVRSKNDLIAEKIIIDEVKAKANIKISINAKILKLQGKQFLEEAIIDDNGIIKTKKVAAVFPYIGHIPATKFLEKTKILNENNYIKINENMETTINNIYAVGDVTTKEVRQIVTAASDGAIAAKHIITNFK